MLSSWRSPTSALKKLSPTEVENTGHSDSMSPASLDLLKALLEVGVEDLPHRKSHQMFPAAPHSKSEPSRAFQLPPLSADPAYHQVVIRRQLSPLCPEHTTEGQLTRPQSQTLTSGLLCPGATCTDGPSNLMFVPDKLTCREVH